MRETDRVRETGCERKKREIFNETKEEEIEVGRNDS